jgi:hypothetical protein
LELVKFFIFLIKDGALLTRVPRQNLIECKLNLCWAIALRTVIVKHTDCFLLGGDPEWPVLILDIDINIMHTGLLIGVSFESCVKELA